jgi:hypothetical protein
LTLGCRIDDFIHFRVCLCGHRNYLCHGYGRDNTDEGLDAGQRGVHGIAVSADWNTMQQQNRRTQLLSLPMEILTEILPHLEWDDLLHVRQVLNHLCKSFFIASTSLCPDRPAIAFERHRIPNQFG